MNLSVFNYIIDFTFIWQDPSKVVMTFPFEKSQQSWSAVWNIQVACAMEEMPVGLYYYSHENSRVFQLVQHFYNY